jgi:hypothetical protein
MKVTLDFPVNKTLFASKAMGFRMPLWWIKFSNYEYWPMFIFYLPMLPYWLFQSIRARSFTYFTNINPTIAGSRFYGEKKNEILDLIPQAYQPQSKLIQKNEALEIQINVLELQFPLIAKPNVGERGNGVAKIKDLLTLQQYHLHSFAESYLIQEFIPYNIELGILYSRMPNEKKGKISSITLKEFLHVIGDGRATLEALVKSNDRARFQEKRLQQKFAAIWQQILPEGQKLELETIGNHCRGTRFINANYLNCAELETVFDELCTQIEGFHYGRFDLRVRSLNDLYYGQTIKIMELNGVSSDPGHIYDTRLGIFQAYRDLAWHWNRIANISIQNRKLGYRPISIAKLWSLVMTSSPSKTNV